MTWADAFRIVGSSTLAQLCAGWSSVLPIGALAIYGWYRGGFLAAIAGLHVMAAFLAALALSHPASSVVESLGCPASQSLAVAYALVFAAGIVGIRLAVGAAVPDGAFRMGPLVDQFTGVLLGAGAGLVLGGALLVGWSMADMPAWFRLDDTHQPLDSGGRVLWTFARFACRAAPARDLLLDGDRPAADANGDRVIRASEPFADTNGNGTWDAGGTIDMDGEPYLDVDRSGTFTPDMAWSDVAGDGRRSPGLRDCYRLAEWRRVRAMHAPRIESPAAVEVTENAPLEDVVYRARAIDVDGDAIRFGVEPVVDPGDDATPGEEALGAVIDPASGAVTLVEPADFERAGSHEFVVVATDATGLQARKRVRLRVRDMLLEPAAP